MRDYFVIYVFKFYFKFIFYIIVRNILILLDKL